MHVHIYFIFSYSNNAYPNSIRCYVIESYFELLKSCSEEPFSAEMTVLVCEPIIHAIGYCESKAFFKQCSEALIQGLLPGEDDEAEGIEDEEEENGEDIEDENESEELLEGSEASGLEEELEDDEEAEASGKEFEFDSEEFDNIKDEGCESNISDSEWEGSDEECEQVDGGETCGELCHKDEEEMDSECESEDEDEEAFIFDYSLLGKFIFDFGAREDVLVRNRRFLYELSQIIEEVATGTLESSCCHEGESCCK